ncbi:rhodanese-like domain-containing protein [uncultured Winogradskyella sp.]|uniref:rhodanese-like domain-containing protein n=1 Tax=uncultured Winogradskyella sp. TaxID=395353 RepID=UPI0030ED557B|tara:strand:+ start:1779 stop:2300 length:522 start_codon:yes stop_codon:yes gene_type:complete
MIKLKIISIYVILIFSISLSFAQNKQNLVTKKVNYDGFVTLSDSLRTYREARLIDEATFNIYRLESNTIILDTRSKKAFDEIHIKGAIHLNFSDFTEANLKSIIPDNKTRILIYCNNNFESKKPSLFDKSVRLALNIPTFINLYGYDYKNIYELEDYLKEEETIIPLITNDKK